MSRRRRGGRGCSPAEGVEDRGMHPRWTALSTERDWFRSPVRSVTWDDGPSEKERTWRHAPRRRSGASTVLARLVGGGRRDQWQHRSREQGGAALVGGRAGRDDRARCWRDPEAPRGAAGRDRTFRRCSVRRRLPRCRRPSTGWPTGRRSGPWLGGGRGRGGGRVPGRCRAGGSLPIPAHWVDCGAAGGERGWAGDLAGGA